MTPSLPVAEICSRWFGTEPTATEPLATGGFSGGPVIAVFRPATGERFVLKRFPSAATRDRGLWIHALVNHLRGDGVPEVPEPVATPRGDTVVETADGLWEMSRFMPGLPVPDPTVPQSGAAAACLARIHRAAAGFPAAVPGIGTPPAWERRAAQARMLLERPWRIEAAAAATGAADFEGRLRERLAVAIRLRDAHDVGRLLAEFVARRPGPVSLQACLRDVWHAHVFHADRTAERVTAVIDLHAAAIDTPATDLARLLGSWDARADREHLPLGLRWREAVDAYETVRPLSPAERSLVTPLHAMGVVLGLDNWFRWTLVERRRFPASDGVIARIDGLLRELPAAVSAAWGPAGNAD